MAAKLDGGWRPLLLLLWWWSDLLLGRCSTSSQLHNIQWANHGGGILNHRSALGPNKKINGNSVSKLELKWKFLTGFDVSATPSIADETIYFPGWNGNLYALDAKKGNIIWERNLTNLVGYKTVSRATPVIYKKMLLVGLYGPAIVIAIDRQLGTLIWQTNPLEDAPFSVITMSGTTFEGFYFVGVSSLQEVYGTCCTFQGSFQKISLEGGKVVWKTYMLPPNSGYFGAGVWGSSPSIDEGRQLVYIATGNNYKVPQAVEDCEESRSNNTILNEPDPCHDTLDRQDAIVALHIKNGSIAWSRSLQAYDVWTYVCLVSPNITNCPTQLGQDYDFGEAPMLVYVSEDGESDCSSMPYEENVRKRCLAIAGQKSGMVWALDCDNGTTVWSMMAGPGGYIGGASWGMCTDGERVYTNIINDEKKNFTLIPTYDKVTNGGGWVAMDARTGKVIWSTKDPTSSLTPGPLSVTNGVVFAGSFSPNGDVYALDAYTGTILWHNTTGAPIYGGFSISDHCIYGGNGYSNVPIPGSASGVVVSAYCVS